MSRKARSRQVQDRLKHAESRNAVCIVLGCNNPTRAAASEGFDQRFCRQHAEHNAVHGSPFRRSYTAQELRPARKAAQAWLNEQKDSRGVLSALERLRILYHSAGPNEPAHRLKGIPPKERARKAWARLRAAKVAPEKVLLAWLAVTEAIRTDTEADTKPEFRRVQAAKLVHRLASGTHKRWERERADGSKHVERLDVYPRSRGRVLRVLGEDIERAMEPLDKGTD